MNTGVLQEEMLQYFSLLKSSEQQSILSMIKTFIKNREEYEPVTLEQYNIELEEADSDIEAGYFEHHEEVKARLLRK